jgi:SSS family solute:Na+ symporter
MAICFFIVLLAGGILTLIKPMMKPVDLPQNDQIELKNSRGAMMMGVGVVVATLALYVIFW